MASRRLAVGAIEQEVVAVAVGLREQLARLAVDRAVDQDRSPRWRPSRACRAASLAVPRHLAGVGIERDDRARVEVRAFAALAVVGGRRLAGRHVQQVQLRIVGRRLPRRAGALQRARRSATSRSPAAPSPASCTTSTPTRRSPASSDSMKPSVCPPAVAADADEHVLANDDRRRGGPVRRLRVVELVRSSAPCRSRLRATRRSCRASRRKASCRTCRRRGCRSRCGPPDVVPDLLAGARVDRVDVVRCATDTGCRSPSAAWP